MDVSGAELGKEAPVQNQTVDSEARTEAAWPLSVSPAQLRSLALAREVAFEQGVRRGGPTTEGDTYSRLQTAILGRDNESVTDTLTELEASDSQDATALLESLTTDVDPDDILEQGYEYKFLQWYSRDPSHFHHTQQPTREGSYLVHGLASRVLISPEFNMLVLNVRPHTDDLDQVWNIQLPLDQQTISWAYVNELYGPINESLQSKTEVFKALASQEEMVYTHLTGEPNLANILLSEDWGKTSLRGSDPAAKEGGLNVEEAALQADADELKDILSSYYVNKRGNENAPVILFDKDVTEHRRTVPNPGGIALLGSTQFDDPNLIGIWVSPTYRRLLLRWIDTWPQEEKDRIFKGRSPESILIASADQLPEKYRNKHGEDHHNIDQVRTEIADLNERYSEE